MSFSEAVPTQPEPEPEKDLLINYFKNHLKYENITFVSCGLKGRKVY